MLSDQTILITGITGSLGSALATRILAGEWGVPERVIGLSRDEEKQHRLRIVDRGRRKNDSAPGAPVCPLELRIGDVRDEATIASALDGVGVVFHSAALKQVPTCEYHPEEALRTNVGGPQNIARVIAERKLPVEVVVGISTDKACLPVSVLGMTKALAERVFIRANLAAPNTRFLSLRSGNLIGSRGSVIPHFLDQIAAGGPVTLTDPSMTRFLLTVDTAVEAAIECVRSGKRGEILVPAAPSVRLGDLAAALIGERKIETEILGARPGEKRHEWLISEEEGGRTVVSRDHFAITPHLPELREERAGAAWLRRELRSDEEPLPLSEVEELIATIETR